MALLPIVTIKKVSKPDNVVVVIANLTLKDTELIVLTQNFSVRFRPGIDDGVKEDIEDTLLSKMQKSIDQYKAGAAIGKSPKVVALKTNLESRLVV